MEKSIKKRDARALNEECSCGSPSFCDTFSFRIVQCRKIGRDECMLFETSEIC